MIFIIDQGHRKDTPGKRYKGFREYEFNEDVSHRLKKRLEKAGQKVILTMTTDEHPYSEITREGRIKNLQYRCDVANKVKEECVFVSIHANAAENENASGYVVFHYHTSKEGKRLAECMHNAAKDTLSVGDEVKDRGIKTEGFYVLKYTWMPAILIEHEFFTNDKGRERLESDEFRIKCVDHIFKGLMDYAGIDIETDYKILYEQSERKLKVLENKLEQIKKIVEG